MEQGVKRFAVDTRNILNGDYRFIGQDYGPLIIVKLLDVAGLLHIGSAGLLLISYEVGECDFRTVR